MGGTKHRTKTFFCQDYLTIDDSIYTTIQEICKGRYPEINWTEQNDSKKEKIIKKKIEEGGEKEGKKYQKENVFASKSS